MSGSSVLLITLLPDSFWLPFTHPSFSNPFITSVILATGFLASCPLGFWLALLLDLSWPEVPLLASWSPGAFLASASSLSLSHPLFPGGLVQSEPFLVPLTTGNRENWRHYQRKRFPPISLVLTIWAAVMSSFFFFSFRLQL